MDQLTVSGESNAQSSILTLYRGAVGSFTVLQLLQQFITDGEFIGAIYRIARFSVR